MHSFAECGKDKMPALNFKIKTMKRQPRRFAFREVTFYIGNKISPKVEMTDKLTTYQFFISH
ncbi:hypothetical protein PN36_10150 [Candidatus Thiomargarita nelsonii]|uniref:Uncharacterized protein n=1 Tax=Candidatus Thiomargarita nelsonii TaxID=1003181 RepID=A0A4E0R3H0_9GAMM|nr:hypothetical protein PN36_10150 [Candidatus Thiomargarita nelsonii]